MRGRPLAGWVGGWVEQVRIGLADVSTQVAAKSSGWLAACLSSTWVILGADGDELGVVIGVWGVDGRQPPVACN